VARACVQQQNEKQKSFEIRVEKEALTGTVKA